ncbi:hypothetical protein V1520DRAFT_60299 [Lipomyces starkeyi]
MGNNVLFSSLIFTLDGFAFFSGGVAVESADGVLSISSMTNFFEYLFAMFGSNEIPLASGAASCSTNNKELLDSAIVWDDGSFTPPLAFCGWSSFVIFFARSSNVEAIVGLVVAPSSFTTDLYIAASSRYTIGTPVGPFHFNFGIL